MDSSSESSQNAMLFSVESIQSERSTSLNVTLIAPNMGICSANGAFQSLLCPFIHQL